ncbi:MAG: VOC family protein [Spirosomataceae bacterium]
MATTTNPSPNIQQAVPFFLVTDIETSLRYYTQGLGFAMSNSWIDEGKLQWCWLQNGNAALMLQELRKEGVVTHQPEGKLREGVSICFICRDALAIYDAIIAKGIVAAEPFVGNNMWVVSVTDPDGYRLDFESMTDVPEGTLLSEWRKTAA